MITPSFSLTATERVLPRLALDFTTASLDPRVTFTRTGNTATVTNSSGYVEPINADLPRFDFNPITLACKGLLIEEAKTNICLQSADFATTWTLLGATVSTNQINSPSNTLTADKIIVDNGASMGSGVTQTIVAAAATYTLSAFAKIGEFNRVGLFVRDNASAGNNAGVVFSLVDGSITTAATAAGTFTGASATSTLVANGFYRVTLTFTSTGASALRTRVTVYDSVATTGDGTKGIYAWGAQLEAGAFATSYIPTTTTALTRNADVATMTGTNFSDWYNATEGSLYVEGSHPAIVSVPAEIGVGTLANCIQLYSDAAGLGAAYIRRNSSTQANISRAGVFLANTNGKLAVGTKQNSFQVAGNGNLGGSDVSGNMPISPTAMYIGRAGDSTAYWNGVLKGIHYYNIRLTNAELQAITK